MKKTDLASKFEKMARLAFDPAAEPGESSNAMTMIVDIARKHDVDFDGFKTLLLMTDPRMQALLSSGATQITFGKHKGKIIEQVFRDDPNYLDWVLTKGENMSCLKIQIRRFLGAMQQN